MSKRFVKVNEKVYWAELEPVEGRKLKYTVHEGYYLASYKTQDASINVISLGEVSSCVVRHLRDYDVFNIPELAQQRADELNKEEGR